MTFRLRLIAPNEGWWDIMPGGDLTCRYVFTTVKEYNDFSYIVA
ncbi:MAG: hypothetical protein ANABAC_1108 [Anaerolineae bacterium]|nr:MAG: hypothetical protein ANABAC_1108 [Anaerolineae bacterium]